MAPGEEMLRDQINRVIARTELRVEQQSIRAGAGAPYGREAKTARREVASMLRGLAKLKTLSEQFCEPDQASCEHPTGGGRERT